jgi:hypothetical protein
LHGATLPKPKPLFSPRGFQEMTQCGWGTATKASKTSVSAETFARQGDKGTTVLPPECRIGYALAGQGPGSMSRGKKPGEFPSIERKFIDQSHARIYVGCAHMTLEFCMFDSNTGPKLLLLGEGLGTMYVRCLSVRSNDFRGTSAFAGVFTTMGQFGRMQ